MPMNERRVVEADRTICGNGALSNYTLEHLDHLRIVSADIVVDALGGFFVIDMAGRVAVGQHLQPGRFIGEPSGLEGFAQRVFGRGRFHAFLGQETLERLPK